MNFEQFFLNLQNKAIDTCHRQLLWLAGDKKWCFEQLYQVKKHLLSRQSVLVSNKNNIEDYFNPKTGFNVCNKQVVNKDTKQLLGTEFEFIVFDSFAGFNPDHFAQIIGTLKAGSLLLLITPSSDSWMDWRDLEISHIVAPPYTEKDVTSNFLTWLLTCLNRYISSNRAETHYYSQHKTNLLNDISCTKKSSLEEINRRNIRLDYQQALDDQQLLVDQCSQFLLSHQSCYIVVAAARGRGKSVALGLLANKLNNHHIYLTSSDPQAVMQIQRFSKTMLKYSSVLELLTLENISFENSLLFIDEAASVNIDVLKRLSDKFSKVVFSTTTDGYEGTGQGFTLRFLKYLQKKDIAHQFFQLDKPMRWLPNDSLEQWLNQFLFLDFAPVVLGSKNELLAKYSLKDRMLDNKVTGSASININYDNNKKIDITNFKIKKIRASFLIENSIQLQQLYTLLSQAHYRTTPGDLRIILDSPNIHIWVVSLSTEIIAACLVASEGAISRFPIDSKGMNGDELAQAMHNGLRRPKGNLIPQVLIAQEGFLEAKDFRFARVLRIATNDKYRRLNIASQLIDTIQQWCELENYDFIGASFSIQNDLLAFWKKLGFNLIRIGNQLDKTTASFTSLFMKKVTSHDNLNDKDKFFNHVTRNFYFKHYYQKQRDLIFSNEIDKVINSSCLGDLEVVNVDIKYSEEIISHLKLFQSDIEYHHWCLLQFNVFCYYHRSLESIDYIIHIILIDYKKCWQKNVLSTLDFQLLDEYFFQNKSLSCIYKKFKFSGYRSFIKKMREVCKIVFNNVKRSQE